MACLKSSKNDMLFITFQIRKYANTTNSRREAKRAFLGQDEGRLKPTGSLKQFTLQRVCMSLEKKRNTNRSSQYLVSRETCLGRALFSK